MTDDPALAQLLRRFAKLSDSDREHVLVLLSQAEREALRSALGDSAGTPMSPPLAALVDAARTHRDACGLTTSASRALLAAVDADTGSEPIEIALRRLLPGRRRWLRRFGAHSEA